MYKLLMTGMGGSPGLAVTGGDSCPEGHGFKSQHCILDGYFSHTVIVKILMFVSKGEINEKEAGDGPFLIETAALQSCGPSSGNRDPCKEDCI